jgi:ribonuclease HI
VNWDAAVSKKNGCVGVGIIARDFLGKVCAARSLTVRQIIEPVVAEAMAGVHAMLLGKDLNRSGVILEGDAQQVVNAVNSLNPCKSSYGQFIEDIKEGIRSTGNMSVNFTKRDANYAAHGLASFATTHVVDVLWKEEIPPCVYDIVRREEVIPLP